MLNDVSVKSVDALGTTEHRSNRKNPLARATRGAFNNEPAKDRGPTFQETFKTTTLIKCWSAIKCAKR